MQATELVNSATSIAGLEAAAGLVEILLNLLVKLQRFGGPAATTATASAPQPTTSSAPTSSSATTRAPPGMGAATFTSAPQPPARPPTYAKAARASAAAPKAQQWVRAAPQTRPPPTFRRDAFKSAAIRLEQLVDVAEGVVYTDTRRDATKAVSIAEAKGGDFVVLCPQAFTGSKEVVLPMENGFSMCLSMWKASSAPDINIDTTEDHSVRSSRRPPLSLSKPTWEKCESATPIFQFFPAVGVGGGSLTRSWVL